MKLLNSLIFLFFLIFSLFKPCQAISQNGISLLKPFLTQNLEYIITDLQSLDSTEFTSEANGWVFKGASCPSCVFSMPSGSVCGSAQDPQMVYGGPYAPVATSSSDYYLRDFSASTTAWSRIGMEFDVWVFSTSDIPDIATLTASKFISLRMKNHYFSSSKLVLLGSCSTDFVSIAGNQIRYIYKFHTQYIHSPVTPYPNPTGFGILKRTGTSALPAVDSIGVRNVKFYNLGSSTSTTVSQSFPCTEGNFWNVNSCQACATGCLACSGPNQGQCTGCKSTFYDDGNGMCRTSCTSPFERIPGTMKCASKCAPGFYWARNQTCIEKCEAPLVQSLDGNGAPLCVSPCESSSQYVYPDGSCSSTCDPLLIERNEATIKLCLNPCSTGSFLYPNGACVDTCSTPLSQKTEKNIAYCYSTCSGNVANIIYPDQSCSSTCDPRLKSKTEHGISSCSSFCGSSTEYVYLDSSCKACPSPFTQKTENEIQFCENPCFQNKTFLYEDGTCQEACSLPSIAKDDSSIGKTCKFPCGPVDYYNNRNGKCTKTCEYTSKAIDSPLPKICFSTLSEEEVKEVQAVADTVDSANTATSTGSMVWSIISSSDSTTAMMGPLAKMLQYIKFMDIRFPEKVLILMDAQSKNSGGFSTKMMKGVLKEFPSHELPRKFKVYQSSSSFFVNFWPAFFNLGMILFVTALVLYGTAKTKKHAKINGILKNLTGVLKWNVFLITFSGSVGDIVLYTSMEFQTIKFSNFAAVVSFLLCLATNTLAVMVVMKIIDINFSIRKSKKKTKDEEEHKKIVEQEWSSYKALFECYKDYSFYQQIFMFVFLVRLALFNAMIGYMYNYPLFQATIAVISNILMLGYLIIKRPMKKIVSLIQQIVLEIVLLPFNVCVLALAIMDNHGIVDTERRKSIGNVIVYINVMVPFLSLVLMGMKAIAMGIDFYKSWKLAKKNKLQKLASVQKDFRPSDLLNTTGEKLSTQSFSMESSSIGKSPACGVQIVDLNDQSSMMTSTGHHPVQSNFTENQRNEPNFMTNNYYNQNSIPIATSQNFIVTDFQNSFHQQSQFSMGIMQEEAFGQHFQNEAQNMMMSPPQNHRRRINKKRRDNLQVQNHDLNGGIA